MSIERTLSIIKPDAVKRNISGNINAILEENGFKIIAQKRILLTEEQAKQFYAIHKDRPFFNDLIDTITSYPVIVQVLERENAVAKYREVIGDTDPKKAEPNTIRAKFALSIGENSVHGSDSIENAKIESQFFFSGMEIISQ